VDVVLVVVGVGEGVVDVVVAATVTNGSSTLITTGETTTIFIR